MAGVNTRTQGRRGYYLYEYGPHLWFPEVQADWSGGMFRDVPRNEIPANGVYDSLDFILSTPGVAQKRGPTTRMSSTAATSLLGTVTYIGALAQYSGLSGFSQICGVTDLGDFIDDLSATTPKAIGACVVTNDTPKTWFGATNLLIITNSAGTSVPYYFNATGPPRPLGATTRHLAITGTPTGGTITVTAILSSALGIFASSATASIAFNSSSASAVTALNAMGLGTFTATGGALPGTPLEITPPTGVAVFLASGYNSLTGGSSPAATITWTGSASNCPAAYYSCIHLSRVVLAGGSSNAQRVYFSPATDPTAAWDATAYVDANYPVTGLGAVGGALLVFSKGHLEKFVGDTPPPGSNFTHIPVADIGCSDARSITYANGMCIFANANGVYQTNGITVESLTEGKIGTYWRSQVSSMSVQGRVMAAGVKGGRYLYVSLKDDPSGFMRVGLMCDLTTRSWWRISSPTAAMYAVAPATYSQASDALYASGGSAFGAYGFDVSGHVTAPGTDVGTAADGDTGLNVTPLLETRPFGNFPGVAAFGKAHITYDLRDTSSLNHPTLSVQAAPGLGAPTYTAVAESPLAATTVVTRQRFSVGKRSQALSLKIKHPSQGSNSNSTEIHAIEVDTRGFPRDTGGQ